MKEQTLGALFFPKGTKKNPVKFDELFIPYIYREIYFESLYVDITNGKTDMTIIDVGANIGVTVQYFRQFAKKIYGIEPSSTHFEALSKNKEFNEWDNVELTNAAVADKDGEMVLNTLGANRTCYSLINDYHQGGEKVKTIAMDTFFKVNKIKKCDFMKFDVEGAEDLILRSDAFKRVAKKIDAIMVEFHYPTWKELVKYMMELGYTARQYQSSAIVILFTRE